MGRRTVIGMTFPSFILFCIRATFVFCLTGLDSGLCWASFRPDHAFLSALGYPPFRPRLPFMPSFGTKEDPTQPSPGAGFLLLLIQEKASPSGEVWRGRFSFLYGVQFHAESFSYAGEGHMTVDDVESEFQSRVFGTGLLPAFVSQSQRVGQGGVGQCECRSERHSAGNVGHAVVYDAIYFVHRLSVCRRV